MLLANPTVDGYTLVSEWGGCVRFGDLEPRVWQLEFGALCDVDSHGERAIVASIDGSVRDFYTDELLCGPDTPQQHRAALLPSGDGGAVIGRTANVRVWGDVADVGSLANLGVPFSPVVDILVAPDGQGYLVLALPSMPSMTPTSTPTSRPHWRPCPRSSVSRGPVRHRRTPSEEISPSGIARPVRSRSTGRTQLREALAHRAPP